MSIPAGSSNAPTFGQAATAGSAGGGTFGGLAGGGGSTFGGAAAQSTPAAGMYLLQLNQLSIKQTILYFLNSYNKDP